MWRYHYRLTLGWLSIIYLGAITAPFDVWAAAEVNVEARHYKSDSHVQDDDHFALTGRYHAAKKFENDVRLSWEIYGRYDPKDDNSTHLDARELYFRVPVTSEIEVEAGFKPLAWGVVASKSVVNVADQLDRLEGLTSREKLGRPMVGATISQGSVQVKVHRLLWNRTRDFPGARKRLTIPVDRRRDAFIDSSECSSSYAARFQQSFSRADLGLTYYNGVNIDPSITAEQLNDESVAVLTYGAVEVWGVYSSFEIGPWLINAEGAHRREFYGVEKSLVAGLERRFDGFLQGNIQLNLEYLYDSRKNHTSTLLSSNHAYVSASYVFNDFSNTRISLTGYIGLGDAPSAYDLSVSRTFSGIWNLAMSLRKFDDLDFVGSLFSGAPADSLNQNNDNLELKLTRFF